MKSDSRHVVNPNLITLQGILSSHSNMENKDFIDKRQLDKIRAEAVKKRSSVIEGVKNVEDSSLMPT